MSSCGECGGEGRRSDGSVCPVCSGRGVVLQVRGAAEYFWGEEASGDLPIWRKLSSAFTASARLLALLLTCFSLFYGLYFIAHENQGLFAIVQADIAAAGLDPENIFMNLLATAFYFIYESASAFGVIFSARGFGPLLFWLGVSGAIYADFLSKAGNLSEKEIDLSSPELKAFYEENPVRLDKPVDASKFASPDVLNIIEKSLDAAHGRTQTPSALHIAKILQDYEGIRELEKRLEIDSKELAVFTDAGLKELPSNDHFQKEGKTIMSPELKKLALAALQESLSAGFDKIEPEALFLALFYDKGFDDYFHAQKLDRQDARGAVLWSKHWSGIRTGKSRPRKIRHAIMNKAWTARMTPELDQFSYDMTDYARSGLTGYVVNRQKELDELMRILERTSQNNALLIGEEGCGRTTIVKALANRMISDDVLPTLRDKRLVVLDISVLVAGVRAGGDLELRIQKVLEDMGRGGNIILYIPDIHNMAAAGSGEGFDASKVLAPILSQGLFQIIGSTDYQNYRRYIEPRSDFANSFDQVKVNELSEEDSLKVLAIQAGMIESREGVTMTYGAIRKAVELSKRYIPDRLLPGKAVDLLSEAAVEVKRGGAGSVLRDEDIMKIITEKTGIPLTSINSNEAEKLLNLEESLHKRVIGQERAIRSISSAIRRVRVGMKMENRPIGTFLFLGPTGVGKTELAKALAEVYYGSEDAMVRLDMSEYQTVDSVEKLIGYSAQSGAGEAAGGILTEAIKHKPFSLLLLDELEKANRNVLNLFLQVFDDGRLTDNLGRTVDFTNAIIIATSNAGSKELRNLFIDDNADNAKILESLDPYLLQYFTPEFMNRFTDKIVFRSLIPRDLLAIARLQVKGLARRLDEAQGIRIEVSDEALDLLVSAGYSPEYGARFLQRTMQEKLENLIAVEFLKGNIKRGDTFAIGAEQLR